MQKNNILYSTMAIVFMTIYFALYLTSILNDCFVLIQIAWGFSVLCFVVLVLLELEKTKSKQYKKTLIVICKDIGVKSGSGSLYFVMSDPKDENGKPYTLENVPLKLGESVVMTTI